MPVTRLARPRTATSRLVAGGRFDAARRQAARRPPGNDPADPALPSFPGRRQRQESRATPICCITRPLNLARGRPSPKAIPTRALRLDRPSRASAASSSSAWSHRPGRQRRHCEMTTGVAGGRLKPKIASSASSSRPAVMTADVRRALRYRFISLHCCAQRTPEVRTHRAARRLEGLACQHLSAPARAVNSGNNRPWPPNC